MCNKNSNYHLNILCDLGTVLDIHIVYLDLKAVLYILVIPLLQIRKLIYTEVKSTSSDYNWEQNLTGRLKLEDVLFV